MRTLGFIALIALAGCATPEEQRAQMVERAKQSCYSYGLTDTSADMPRCIQAEIHSIEQQQTMAAAAILASGPLVQPYQPNTLNCTTSGTGNFVNTTCY